MDDGDLGLDTGTESETFVDADRRSIFGANVKEREFTASLDAARYLGDERGRESTASMFRVCAHRADLGGGRESQPLSGHRHEVAVIHVEHPKEVAEFVRTSRPRPGFRGVCKRGHSVGM